MGMSASQARFLTLTARKSNVEYQGQQINQQRTALANESSNIFSQLQELEVPTPPVVRDYMTTQYTFSTNALSETGAKKSYSLNGITSTPEGDFASVTTTEDSFGVVLDKNGINGGIISSSVDVTDSEIGDASYSITINGTSYPITVQSVGEDGTIGEKTLALLTAQNKAFENATQIATYVIDNQTYFIDPTTFTRATDKTNDSATTALSSATSDIKAQIEKADASLKEIKSTLSAKKDERSTYNLDKNLEVLNYVQQAIDEFDSDAAYAKIADNEYILTTAFLEASVTKQSYLYTAMNIKNDSGENVYTLDGALKDYESFIKIYPNATPQYAQHYLTQVNNTAALNSGATIWDLYESTYSGQYSKFPAEGTGNSELDSMIEAAKSIVTNSSNIQNANTLQARIDYINTLDSDIANLQSQADELVATIAAYNYQLNESDDISGIKSTLNGVSAYKIVSEDLKVTNDYNVINYVENDLGRLASVTLQMVDSEGNPRYRYDDDGNKIPETLTFELDCIEVEDEAAYDQAMLDYEYAKSVYDKTQSDINAKTEAIQKKDRTLEIKLKQLDTEQNAISTEMDAVQKVVDDNVESTFKTFG